VFKIQNLIVDVQSCQTYELDQMCTTRVGNGLCKIGQYVYAIGGLTSDNLFMGHDACERLNLDTNKWQEDVPKL